MQEDEEDFRDNKEFLEFCQVLDESKQEFHETVRFKLGKEFQKGWGHNSIYNVKEFKNKTLDSLEATRRDLSCKSAEELIDILYTLGYADKRIIYIIWKLGYLNISFRDYRKYKEDNKVKLKKLQEEYLRKMSEKKQQLFQQRQEDVLRAEEKTLQIYLDNIAIAQQELESNPRLVIDEPTKFNRLTKTINTLQEKIDSMHAITDKRKASIEINKELALAEGLAKVKNGPSSLEDAKSNLTHEDRLLD